LGVASGVPGRVLFILGYSTVSWVLSPIANHVKKNLPYKYKNQNINNKSDNNQRKTLTALASP